jgi:hypothetical protein
LERKYQPKGGQIKAYDNPKNLKKFKKSYEIFYDEISERYVLQIIDVDSLFPLLIKVPSIGPRELIFTNKQKLHLT